MGKVALVTGSAGYVGSAVAKRLAGEGLRIALLYHAVEPDIASLPGTGHAAYQVDLTKEDEVQAAVDATEHSIGPVSVLVHTAGKAPVRGALTDATLASVREEFETNAAGSFLILREVAKRMKERKDGLIIGITSIAAENSAAGKGLGAYVPAKAALRSMLGLLKAELATSGVRVEEVAPGFMPDGMNADLPAAFKEMGKARNPPGIPSSADEVAEAILRLI